jgi:hypothetical protein
MTQEPTGPDQFAVIVDYLFPELDAYEAALYVFLYRRTHHVGRSSIRVGKRTIAEQFVKAARGGGRENRGGTRGVNYWHLSEALEALDSKGCLLVGDTTRKGTLYTVVLPSDIPGVRVRIAKVTGATGTVPDWYRDPVRRMELFERDRWTCRYCGEVVNPENATLDHFIPQSKEGANTPENLRTACLSCNSIKSGRTYEEVAAALLESVARRRANAVQVTGRPK